MTNLEKVKKFIKDNKIDLSGEDSGLNGACTIVAGFICYVVAESTELLSEPDEAYNIIEGLDLNYVADDELLRVFEFAWYNNYGDFWHTDEAREQYTF